MYPHGPVNNQGCTHLDSNICVYRVLICILLEHATRVSKFLFHFFLNRLPTCVFSFVFVFLGSGLLREHDGSPVYEIDYWWCSTGERGGAWVLWVACWKDGFNHPTTCDRTMSFRVQEGTAQPACLCCQRGTWGVFPNNGGHSSRDLKGSKIGSIATERLVQSTRKTES